MQCVQTYLRGNTETGRTIMAQENHCIPNLRVPTRTMASSVSTLRTVYTAHRVLSNRNSVDPRLRTSSSNGPNVLEYLILSHHTSNKTNPISGKVSFQKLWRTDNSQTVSLKNQHLLSVDLVQKPAPAVSRPSTKTNTCCQ